MITFTILVKTYNLSPKYAIFSYMKCLLTFQWIYPIFWKITWYFLTLFPLPNFSRLLDEVSWWHTLVVGVWDKARGERAAELRTRSWRLVGWRRAASSCWSDRGWRRQQTTFRQSSRTCRRRTRLQDTWQWQHSVSHITTFSLLLVVTSHLVLEVFTWYLLLSGIVYPLTSILAKLSQHSTDIRNLIYSIQPLLLPSDLKLLKLVHAWRNYSLPKLASFLCCQWKD